MVVFSSMSVLFSFPIRTEISRLDLLSNSVNWVFFESHNDDRPIPSMIVNVAHWNHAILWWCRYHWQFIAVFVDNSLLAVVIVLAVIAIVAIIAGVILLILYLKLRAAYKRSWFVFVSLSRCRRDWLMYFLLFLLDCFFVKLTAENSLLKSRNNDR